MIRALLSAAAMVLSLPAAASPATSRAVTIFAAASLKNALDAVSAAYMRDTGQSFTISYAASSALARQIEQGAPAEIFLSADGDWMDYIAAKDLLDEASRTDLLGNQLVLIAPVDSAIEIGPIDSRRDLAALAGGGRIALADTRAVPAGKYARAALQSLGQWASVEAKLAMAENVRAALALVARREAPLGIVYASDAKAEPRVKIVGVFQPTSHPAIVYPAALTKQAGAAAGRFFRFLRTDASRRAFAGFGFIVIE